VLREIPQGARFRDAVRLPIEVQSDPALVDHIATSGTLPGVTVEEIPVRLPEDAALASASGTWHLRLARGFGSDLEGALLLFKTGLVGGRAKERHLVGSRFLPLVVRDLRHWLRDSQAVFATPNMGRTSATGLL
jgi:hypothetical protein